MNELFEYLLRLGDDGLIAAQRLGEWSARAPEMELDIALSNVALDQLGAARLFLTYAGEVEGAGRDEDALAYLRDDTEFRNAQLVELADADFATAIAKLLFLSAYQHVLYDKLTASADRQVAAIAAKTVKESAYHLDLAALWAVRLGDGTDESHRRMQAAVNEVWPYTNELFESDPVARAVAEAGTGVDPAELREPWLATMTKVLGDATVEIPDDSWQPSGGRSGHHTEALSYLLAEMQVLHRAYPGARW